jgi:hypothetical protein
MVLQRCEAYCNAKEEGMPGIDLTLAVNYIPAVDCLSKTVAIVSSMAFVDDLHQMGAFLIIALMLNVDRVFACTRIFDGNAVLCTILGSWVVNFLRVGSNAPRFLNPLITVVWCFGALCMLLEPARLKAFILSEAEQSSHNGSSWGPSVRVDVSADGGRACRLKRIVPILATSVCVGTIAFTQMESEGWAVRFGRSLSFSALCVVWVYLVGVWRRSGGAFNTFTQNLVGRFCPVLFVNAVCASLFVMACLVGFGYLYFDMHRPPPGPGSTSSEQDYKEVCMQAATSGPMMTITEEDTDEDLEACLRMARQGRAGANV